MTELTPEALVAGSSDMLVVADRGHVRFLIINRPEARNAMSLDFRIAYAGAIADAEADDNVKVVIIAGVAGHFSAGVDLKDHLGNPGRPMFRPHPGEATRAVTKPVIAAIDGYCLTGGLELALSCSFLIGTDRAIFGDTHAKVGLFPGWGLSALLPRTVGVRRARQMSITGERISADRAYEWGLVNELVPPDRLLPRCMEIADAIVACDESSVRKQLELSSAYDSAPLAMALAAEDVAVIQRRRAAAAMK